MTSAKKHLLLTRMKADPLKEFKAMTLSSERPYYALNLISNCHLECSYCILQSYLFNNPMITIFTNLEEILERLQVQIGHIPKGSIIGTGKIADSLALDEISHHTLSLIPFFARQEAVLLELKTKSDFVENLLSLDHCGKTIVSWSLNPDSIIEREEYKTASLDERLTAAKKVSEREYPIAFHFDPIIFHENWKVNYLKTIRILFDQINRDKISWVSLGALRFPNKQIQIIKKRFPKNNHLLDNLVSTNKTVLHYPDELRKEILQTIESELLNHLPATKIYQCMEF